MIKRTITFALAICCLCFSNANAAIVVAPGDKVEFEYDFSADQIQPIYTFAELSLTFVTDLPGEIRADVRDTLNRTLFTTTRFISQGQSGLVQGFPSVSIGNVQGLLVIESRSAIIGLDEVKLRFANAGGVTSAQTFSPVATPIPGALPLAATAFLALGYVARKRRKARAAG